MPYEEVSDPVPGREAFRRFDSAAVQSQAAFLLLLGRQMGRGPKTGLKAVRDSILEEDRPQFPLPPILHSARIRVGAADIQPRLHRRYGPSNWIASSNLVEILPDLVRRLNKEPTGLAAAELMEACLFHPDSLVQVAAAASYLGIYSDWGSLLSILERGTYDQDSLVRDVAATTLARVARSHPRLTELARRVPVRTDGEPSQTSLLVHGTFARNSSWWQPGGDFHSYLLQNVRKDLYGGQDVFSWSGLYNHMARNRGALNLAAWATTRRMNGLDHLFAHSHGGSVAMLGTQRGLDIEKLILLSCPVHDNYLPDFNRVRKVISIRVRLDLIILAGRGGQKYNHPQIQEHVLPVWFKHSATHDPNVWQKHNIQALL